MRIVVTGASGRIGHYCVREPARRTQRWPARLAVEADGVESGPYNITGAEVVMELDAASLIQRYCGDTEIRPELQGRASPLSCAKARQGFGCAPRYHWSMGLRHPET